MRIAQINMVHFGSTGKIMFQIAKAARNQGHEMRTFSTYPVAKRWIKVPSAPQGHTYYGSRIGNAIHLALARLTGYNCFYSRFSTRRLIRKLKAFAPDVLHLHNLHAGYVNLPLLLDYVKKNNIRVIWTLHDCWSFTGCCPHFAMIGCEKWKDGCGNCPKWRIWYKGPDRSAELWKAKKRLITSLKQLTLVTPSQWLAELTRDSYLKAYPVQVINNGIDLSVFQPTSGDFRKKYHCEDKFILLGVSFAWGYGKGLDVFLELAKQLDDSYQIVLVGTNERVEAMLPENIISIRKTESQQDLAEIYTAVDLFINPTREDTYPTVNMESLACGTPVLTFRTGGSPEIPDETCGSAVACDDVQGMLAEIQRIRAATPYTKEACLLRAETFDMYQRFEEYIQLYHQRESL